MMANYINKSCFASAKTIQKLVNKSGAKTQLNSYLKTNKQEDGGGVEKRGLPLRKKKLKGTIKFPSQS